MPQALLAVVGVVLEHRPRAVEASASRGRTRAWGGEAGEADGLVGARLERWGEAVGPPTMSATSSPAPQDSSRRASASVLRSAPRSSRITRRQRGGRVASMRAASAAIITSTVLPPRGLGLDLDELQLQLARHAAGELVEAGLHPGGHAVADGDDDQFHG